MVPVVNIDNTVIQVLPFSKRLAKWILFVQAVCFPVKWLYNVLFGYMNGVSITNFDQTTLYTINQEVIFNYAVWQNTYSANIDNIPDSPSPFTDLSSYVVGNSTIRNGVYLVCIVDIPVPETFDPAHWAVLDGPIWMKVNDSFIGAREMAHYGGRRLNLEWALNRYFQTTFRQPNDPISPTPSDIYITNTPPVYVSFVSFTTESLTSDVYTVVANGYSFTTEVYAAASSYFFAIHIPTAVYAAINADSTIAETIVRQFMDRYKVSGVEYSIITY